MKTEIIDLGNAAEQLIHAIAAYQIAAGKLEAIESFATRAEIHNEQVVYELNRLQADISRASADITYWQHQIAGINA